MAYLFNRTNGAAQWDDKAGPSQRLFPLSHILAESTRAYRDQKLLLAMYYIASRFLINSSDFYEDDFKINFIPVEGGCKSREKCAKTRYISPVLKRGDESALKTIKRTINGEETKIVFFRAKTSLSILEKRLKKLGGAPLLSRNLPKKSFEEVLSALGSKISPKKADPRLASHLSPLYGFLIAEDKGRQDALSKICGGDKKTLSKLHKLLEGIGDKARRLEASQEAFNSLIEDSNAGLIRPSDVIFAIKNWPLSEEEAKSLVNHLSDAEKKKISEWAREYCLNLLPRVFGVELLEHTSFAQIDEFQALVDMTRNSNNLSEQQRSKIENMDKSFHTLMGLLQKVDADFKKMKDWVNEDAEKWLTALCRQGGSRRTKVFETIMELERFAAELEHNPQVQRNLQLILANISVNLCRISQEEADAWQHFEKFLASKLSHIGKKSLLKKADLFCTEAKKEAAIISELENKTEKEYRSFVNQKAELTSDILSKIERLRSISPQVHEIMKQAFSYVVSHQGYKQWEILSTNPADAYLSRRALSADGSKEAIEAVAGAYSILSKNPKIAREVMQEIERLLYCPTRGFDLESPLGYWASRGMTQKELDVEYWLSQKIDENGKVKDILNLRLKNKHIEVEIKDRLPYDEGFNPQDYIFSNTQKSAYEEIYGRKLSLSEFGITEGDGLGEIYSKLCKIVSSESSLLSTIGEKMAYMDTSTAHFLSTFVEQDSRFGIVTDKLGRNLPSSLSEISENTFEQSLRKAYPDFEKALDEVNRYVLARTALRIVQMMEVCLPSFSYLYLEQASANYQ
ncbi:MAG: hypothetical protein N3E51_03820 [Candidatus Micrarchaeota archaeon]|nr:hypothetical protein [Candidatus Micrarchaeota archaeon]